VCLGFLPLLDVACALPVSAPFFRSHPCFVLLPLLLQPSHMPVFTCVCSCTLRLSHATSSINLAARGRAPIKRDAEKLAALALIRLIESRQCAGGGNGGFSLGYNAHGLPSLVQNKGTLASLLMGSSMPSGEPATEDVLEGPELDEAELAEASLAKNVLLERQQCPQTGVSAVEFQCDTYGVCGARRSTALLVSLDLYHTPTRAHKHALPRWYHHHPIS